MAWAYNTLDGTPNNGPNIAAVALAVTSLALIALCLRLYVRTTIVNSMGHDDWIIIVAWIGCCGYTVATVVQTKWGLGLVHLSDMPDENLLNFGLMQYIGAPFYVIGIWGFKTSLLISYIRLVPGSYRLVPVAFATMVTMAHIAFLCVFLFMCTPIEKQWQPLIPGHCAEAVPFYLTFSSLTIIFDIITLILPFPVLINLQMKLRKKLVLLGLFALGLFVTIVQIIRIQTITSLSNYLDSAKAIKWSIVENAVGIIIACVPTLAPLVKYFSERTTRSGTSTGSLSRSRGRQSGDNTPYALQSWRAKSGMRPLGSRMDLEHVGKHVDASSSKPGDESTENILSVTGSAGSRTARGDDGAGTQRPSAPPSIGTTD